MLTEMDWAERMAIPMPFIQAVGAPDAPAFMAALTAWRWSAPRIDKQLWIKKTIDLRLPKFQNFSKQPNANAIAGFYDSLLRKCLNLYGGSGTAADPLALARHPWTLTPKEFEKNYQEITGGELPDAAIDERRSMGIRSVLIGSAPAAAGIILGVSSAPVTGAVVGVGGVLIMAIGAEVDSSREAARDRQISQLRENLAGYAAIYKKEAAYREKENAAAQVS